MKFSLLRTALCFLGSILWIMPCAQSTVAALSLGETEVRVVKHGSDGDGPLFFNMHDNENTGVESSSKVIAKNGGCLYELVHSGGRYIEFEYDSILFSIDPNRIYTDTGVWRELDRTGVRDTVVFEMVRTFADSLISLLSITDQRLVITLHNNTEGNYSVSSYTRGGAYETDAEAVYWGRKDDPDDFYFVTAPGLYGILTPSKYHVVLQNNATVTDDGSLSVFCAMHDIDYINVEAQHGHKRANRKMVKTALAELDDHYYGRN